MIINYFERDIIDTESQENHLADKFKIIANSNTENASFIHHTLQAAIHFLFHPISFNTTCLINEIPNHLDHQTIVIYFDNIVEDGKIDNRLLQLAKEIKQLIFVGHHKSRTINDNIKCIHIKQFKKIKKEILKEEKIQFGFNADMIRYEKYYYNRMKSYFLNVMNALNKLPIDELERDVEGTCTKILLNRDNFISRYCSETTHIEFKEMMVFYAKILKIIKQNGLVNDVMFYLSKDQFTDMKIDMLNAISDLIEIYHIENDETKVSYVYDKISHQMLLEAQHLNYCHFVNNACVEMRYTDNHFPHSKENGCCNNTYMDKGTNCRYLKEDHSCSICSISCRIFTCQYLQDRGIDHSLWQYPIIDCVFKKMAKLNIIYSFFIPKEDMVKKLKKSMI